MRGVGGLAGAVLLVSGFVVLGAGPLTAGGLPAPPHSAVGGFSVNGAGFSLVFADGSVRPGPFGDVFPQRLPIRITAAAGVPGGGGYWEVAADGNVYSYGNAVAYGGTGGVPLNRPIFAIAPTTSGKGYLLVSRYGGVFTFGDAVYHGSTVGLNLKQPIMGVTTSPASSGYRLVSRDGGVFSFGKIAYEGSLPGRQRARRRRDRGRLRRRAATATGSLERRAGVRVRRRAPFGNGTSSCDRFTAIVANPAAQGYRLVKASGRSVGFGDVPGGAGARARRESADARRHGSSSRRRRSRPAPPRRDTSWSTTRRAIRSACERPRSARRSGR